MCFLSFPISIRQNAVLLLNSVCLPFLFKASFLLQVSFMNSESVDKHKEGLSSIVLWKENI